jgi:hypothetical protein
LKNDTFGDDVTPPLLNEMTDLITESSTPSLLESILRQSDKVFIKKLSNNDRDWSEFRNKHQAGVYVPERERDGGFFPELSRKDREGAEIREAFFSTEWPQVGEVQVVRLVHYTSKGNETHLTRLPKEVFRDLAPASFLVIGRLAERRDPDAEYTCITVDSTTDEADYLVDLVQLDPEEVAVVASPSEAFIRARAQAMSFVDYVLEALQAGTIAEFEARHSPLPRPDRLAAMAQEAFSAETGITRFDPFALKAPGDVIRTISRVYEWEIFKRAQLHLRSIQLVRLIVGDDVHASVERVVRAIVGDYQRIDAMMLSASQQRKSRAGTSFELHIETLLRDGEIPYGRQVVVSSRRPDFVLPSLAFLRSQHREQDDSVVLSAKTTLRERWKQVVREGLQSRLFLATVDETVSAPALEEMNDLGITLVVPESLKGSNVTEYERHPNVIDFKSFFESEVREKRWNRWLELGAF